MAHPDLDLPEPLTLRLYRDEAVVFSSEKHWLHPLFDLEAFFARGTCEPRRTRLVDRILCATEDLLAETRDLEAAWTLLGERRAKALERQGGQDPPGPSRP